MTLREAAIYVLNERGPLHYQELTRAVLKGGLAESSSATPDASLNAMIAVDLKQKGKQSPFIRIKPGVFGLRGKHQGEVVAAVDVDSVSQPDGEDIADQRVRVPLFPVYSELRHLLRVWPGRSRKQITGLQSTIGELRGTPQKTVDWTEPSSWIPERLKGDDHELAEAIWTQSDGRVNPRYTYGHWLLAQKYDFVEDGRDGRLILTASGQDFLDHVGGDTEVALDEAEGLVKLLSIIADNGPARTGGLLEDWSEYLKRRSRFGTDSTFKDTLRRRLNNLRERDLIERRSNMYSVTQAGLEYLQRIGDEDSVGGGEHPEIWTLIRQQESTIRESLRELLLDMDPFTFEHLIKRLLEEMDYQNVEVTSPSGDGGVDVVADIELGITSVREVVQVKRHRRAIQRKDLDALRGSLYRFNAVRGTIITTSRFSKGTIDAAFATGTAPITLIDGDKLIDLLIEHGIGVRKRTVELLEVEPGDFSDEARE
ncbi:restriction endonuclease [Lujinxingia vulgaris]|uniref:Restriction endonuclease n=1 Tax=Lujinxingia vulgaris TaxID=2600176 RepID=A0A5C6WZN7_9DELT|nr:restriction endonuclease [Lujinxingia vulgaris]TXD34239.1 restriction endonuclease [Lujinxingia vulgaris]